jgi:hypothetical protein
MARAIHRILVLTAALIVSACDKYEFPNSPYPGLETRPVVRINSSGATFEADVWRQGPSPIIDHGFVWSETEQALLTNYSHKIQLGAFAGKGEFEANATAGLLPGKTYFVKAFVVTEEHTVYGDPVPFTSQGSTPPVIESFEPGEGTWGDTVVIHGKNFSGQQRFNEVEFGGLASTVVSSNDSTIKFIVPNDVPEKWVKIKVKVLQYEGESKARFTMIGPVITSISPLNGTFGDIVTITGQHFSTGANKNLVVFNEFTAEIVEATGTQLKVRAPSAIRAKENVVTVTSRLLSASGTQKFTIDAPVIISVTPTEFTAGSTVHVTGNNFNPTLSGNKVFLDGATATVESATKTQLTVKTNSRAIYKSRSATIEVVVAEQSASSAQKISLLNRWIRKADVPHGQSARADATAFSIGEFGYVGLGNAMGDKFSRFDPVNNTWTDVAPFPGGSRLGAAAFVIGENAYVGLGVNAPNDFYRYNAPTNTWTRMADFPEPTNSAIALLMNGKGYFLLKGMGENFFEYDPETDTWTMLPYHPFGSDEYLWYQRLDAAFTIDNRLFIYTADRFTLPNWIIEYDFSIAEWVYLVQTGQDSGSEFNTTAFSLNGLGYVHDLTALSRFDPVTNSWSSRFDTRLNDEGPNSVHQGISFTIGNKAYVGAGLNKHELWEFDLDFK